MRSQEKKSLNHGVCVCGGGGGGGGAPPLIIPYRERPRPIKGLPFSDVIKRK